MPRTYGAIQHTRATRDYVKLNWATTTDIELAQALDMKVENLQKLRRSMGCLRSNLKLEAPETVALILELFANGRTLTAISHIVDKKVCRISRLIERYWFYKKPSIYTRTITVQSSMNRVNVDENFI